MLAPLAGRVRVTAFGESNPASDNATVDGRSRNRRVDLRLNLPPPPVPVPTPVPQPTPQPTPEPPGGTTPTPDPPPRPPPPETTRPPPQEDPTFCEEHPILCGLPILPTLPFLSPLLCLVAPELCAGAVCVALPELCLGGPDGPPDPPERRPPDDDDRSGPRVHFIPDVAASNSPAGMPDRIGLRDPVRVTAVVGNPPPPTQPITISVSAPHTAAGNATIDGGASVNIAGTTVLSVLGSQMTQAAVGPHLQLQAAWQSNLVGWSNSFAVSSIAENWWIATTKPPSVGRFGPVIFPDMHFLSDSGNTRDLNECTYVEAVAVNVERGGMTGFGIGKVNDPNKAESCEFPPAFDEHGTPFPWITRPGYSRLNQLWRIHDARAGSGWVASPRSGFTIERIVERDTTNPRCWQLTVRKRGAAVSAYGLAADEGSGDFAHTFRGINCTAPPPRRRDPPPPPPRDVEPPPVPEPRTATPTPQAQAEPQCDRVELARRVDACIEEARQGAIECTARVVLGGGGGWRGVLKGLDYWTCIDDMRTRLLECDREAKRDTHCMGVPPPDPSQVKVAEGDSAPDDDEAFG